jgi:L-lactate dehydrogenase (cytochrome)
MSALARAHTLEDLQRLAARRLPRMIREFVDGGAEGETTLAANQEDFAAISLRPQVLRDVSARDQTVDVFGHQISSPVMLAPAGLARVVDKRGELSAARAAGRMNTVFAVSTASSFSLEEVAEVATGPLWFQLYLWSDWKVIEELVGRAADCGYQTLCLTADVPIVGKRVRDLHNGMVIPPRVRLRGAMDAARRIGWLWDLITGPRITFKNLADKADGMAALGAYVNTELINPAASWIDVERLRSIWDGSLVIKGILTAEDAVQALECGVDGIVVSNHGGRQLDGVPSAIAALPEVAQVARGKAPVFLDGGVRWGSDVVKARALGAEAVFVGRPWFWGLAAGGEDGVVKMLQILEEEIDRTMALLGTPNFSEIDSGAVGKR